jgi:hypothetical protein
LGASKDELPGLWIAAPPHRTVGAAHHWVPF